MSKEKVIRNMPRMALGDAVRDKIRAVAGQAVAMQKHALTHNTDNAGAELTDEQWAAMVVSRIYDEAPLMTVFNMFNMTSLDGHIPRFTNRFSGIAHKSGVSNYIDANKIAATTTSTEDRLMKLIPIVQRVTVDNQELKYTADSNIENSVTENMLKGIGDNVTSAILNGDQRAQANNVNNIAGTGSDVRTSFYGIRAIAGTGAGATTPGRSVEAGVTAIDGSTYTFQTWLNAKAALKEYSKNPAEVVTIGNYDVGAKSAGFEQVDTINEYGPAATIVTGELGKIGGSTFIQTDQIPDRVNAQGVVASGADKLELLLAHGPSQYIGVPQNEKYRQWATEKPEFYGKEFVAAMEVAFNTISPKSMVRVRNIAE